MTPSILTPKMAAEIAKELRGLAANADEPEQYDAKIAALNSIAGGYHIVIQANRQDIRKQKS